MSPEKYLKNLIKQVFIVSLSPRRSLATKCVPLNNEPCVIRPTFIDVNSVELKHYPFISSLDKCSRSCNFVDDLSTNICVRNKTTDVTLMYLTW